MRDFNAVLRVCLAFLAGYVLSNMDHTGREAMMDQYTAWSVSEQRDFIRAAVATDVHMRREIADDWCSINSNTMRACRNARLSHPVQVGR